MTIAKHIGAALLGFAIIASVILFIQYSPAWLIKQVFGFIVFACVSWFIGICVLEVIRMMRKKPTELDQFRDKMKEQGTLFPSDEAGSEIARIAQSQIPPEQLPQRFPSDDHRPPRTYDGAPLIIGNLYRYSYQGVIIFAKLRQLLPDNRARIDIGGDPHHGIIVAREHLSAHEPRSLPADNSA